MKTTRHASPGFTLIEMLVVIGIIAMLLAMLAPTIGRARAEAKAVQCQHNLHTIFSGAAMWRTNNPPGAQLPDGYWRPMLARYVTAKNAWRCPDDEDKDPIKDSPVFNYAIKVNNSSNVFLGYYLELHEGPWCDKKNVTSNSYELWMEDIIGGGDNDREDVMVKVTYNPDGTYTLQCRRGGASYLFDLVDMSTGEIVKTNFGQGGAYTVPGIVEGAVCSYALAGRGLGTPSYYNSHPDRINLNYGNANKLYGIEYPKLVADPDLDNWLSDPIFVNTSTKKVKFARHIDEVNILWGDGHTERVRPKLVDPIDPVAIKTYWNPPQ